ncbi:COP9 signalosome catalytic subunit rri1 [Neophaeococcomyces mojaviensis]|uniref:COP9 signalosome catalytic subunit rri1 n=1 Tax=Neophaeococcomyces mojaviensis TaxID=3383035 RepID=A0ACC3A0X6_9EURO|nr:COP9 signalosome catalytic subunit rri1 [Knufia sp. JES_112]
MSTSAAQRSWEAENEIITIDGEKNALYTLPEATAYKKLTEDTKPWKDDPNYFTDVRISALALLKMTMHARSGGSIEIMGLMLGYVSGRSFIVTDAFRLPVEATETRVNAHEEAYEYMATFPHFSRQTDRQENPIGWYHSHPGYGCWLSGIDVGTQKTWQQGHTPFVAVVIDPDRTVSAGRVEIGAFRTYPDSYRPSDQKAQDDGFQAIPTGKIEDFGAHANDYYPLDIHHFKSTLDQQLLDLLWNKYWTSTLSQSPLFTNAEYAKHQIADHAIKVKEASRKLRQGSAPGPRRTATELAASSDTKTNLRVLPEKSIEQVVKGGNKISQEAIAGLLASDVKNKLFMGVVQEARIAAASAQAIDAAAGTAAAAAAAPT